MCIDIPYESIFAPSVGSVMLHIGVGRLGPYPKYVSPVTVKCERGEHQALEQTYGYRVCAETLDKRWSNFESEVHQTKFVTKYCFEVDARISVITISENFVVEYNNFTVVFGLDVI